MGYYINPPDMSKEEWLEKNAILCSSKKEAMEMCSEDSLIVVLINNGPFTAAGVAYCPDELEAFTDPADPRPKLFYVVLKTDLIKVEPFLKEVIKF